VAAPAIDELAVAAEPDRWRAAGFAVDEDGVCRTGAVRVRLVGEGAGRGIVGLSIRDLAGPGDELPDLDGLPATVSTAPPPSPGRHRNGVERLDHVVALTPDLRRSVATLEGAGLDLRRVREGATPGGASRQAFFRIGEAILEVIEQPAPDGSPVESSKPARLWGMAFVVVDLDRGAAAMGDLLGAARDALQPGRRIATVRRPARLGAAVALITAAPMQGPAPRGDSKPIE